MASDTGLILLFTCCWVLILMCCQSLAGASRLPTAYKRALQEFNSSKPQIIRAELIHRDHPDSSLSLPGGATTSTADRYAASVSRQNARISRRLAAGVEFKSTISSGFPFEVAEYVMTLYFGTPVQKFVVGVDTGSDLIWVQCQPCKSPYQCYNETDPFFVPSASSSYAAVPCDNLTCDPFQLRAPTACNGLKKCEITYAYGTPGSGIEGVLSTETISFSNTTEGQEGISKVLFGCMNNDTASFGLTDGLVGMGRGPLSLPSQLSKLTSFNVFSYCLVPFTDSVNLTSSLLFGASNSNGLKLKYTPILTYINEPTYYWVNLTGISINGTAVRLPRAPLVHNSSTNSGGTIFDSGTTQLIFTQDIGTPVLKSLKDFITYPIVPDNTTLCYNIGGVQQPAFPSMSLHFPGLNGRTGEYQIPEQSLFLPGPFFGYNDTVQCSIIAIADFGLNIIGNIAQADHYIETDLVNMKIGWTSRDCSLPI